MESNLTAAELVILANVFHNVQRYNGAMFTVDLIVTVIKAVRKPERFYPLTQIVPSLRQYFRYLHNFADINLQVETLRSCDWQDATSIT